jgi:hypothetical protein
MGRGFLRRGRTLVLAIALLFALPALLASADAPPGPYLNGFETNTSNWFDLSNGGTSGSISRQSSGYTNSGGYADGINSASGTRRFGLLTVSFVGLYVVGLVVLGNVSPLIWCPSHCP